MDQGHTPFRVIDDTELLRVTLLHRARLDENGCWIWVGSKDTGGYGLISRDCRTSKAHRISYQAFVGPIPDGLVICHSCDTPACINPDHLRAGTMKDNAIDRETRGRRDVKGEQVGTSKLTEQDVKSIVSSGLTGRALAKIFNVSPSTISCVRTGKSWNHLNAAAASVKEIDDGR